MEQGQSVRVPEQRTEGSDAPQCGKGWADRCRNAKGAKCSCKCGGHNHGKNKSRATTRPNSADCNHPYTEPQTEGSITGCWATREVCIWGKPLSPRPSWKLRNHSPDGFAWGYGGSGPAQLALAILLYFVKPETALKNYQQFKEDVIAVLQQGDFTIPVSALADWLQKQAAGGFEKGVEKEKREEILRLTRQRIRAYNAGDSEDYLKLSMEIDMRIKELYERLKMKPL